MFGSTKVKIAAGLATGALTLGAAGAYAAANNAISIANAAPVTVNGATKPAPALLSLSGKAVTIDASKFTNKGECVSTFAKSDIVLTPSTPGTTKVSKNSHGKMVSSIQSWCSQFQKTAATKTADATEATTQTTTTDPTDAADATDTTSSTHGKSGSAHGTGHGRGHSND